MEGRKKVEALLFSSGKKMSLESLKDLSGLGKKELKKALEDLKERYDSEETALKIFNEGDSWKMMVKDNYVDMIKDIVADTELSKATLETLAVIAYNHPEVLQSEVVEKRGQHAYDHISELEELGFVKKVRSGRTYSLTLSDKFFDYFELEGVDDIKEFFKNVRPDLEEKAEEKGKEKAEEKIGDLEVVDVEEKEEDPGEEEEDGEKLDDLEVVDVDEETAEEEKEEEQEAENTIETGSSETSDTPSLPDESKSSEGEEGDFLSEIDKQIDEVAERNQEREEDEELKLDSDTEEQSDESQDSN